MAAVVGDTVSAGRGRGLRFGFLRWHELGRGVAPSARPGSLADRNPWSLTEAPPLGPAITAPGLPHDPFTDAQTAPSGANSGVASSF